MTKILLDRIYALCEENIGKEQFEFRTAFGRFKSSTNNCKFSKNMIYNFLIIQMNQRCRQQCSSTCIRKSGVNIKGEIIVDRYSAVIAES